MAELDHPTPHRLVTGLDPARRQQFLDIPYAEREAKIQPNRVSDHIRREPVTFERDQFCRASNPRHLIAADRR
jgi:hypothetical protein